MKQFAEDYTVQTLIFFKQIEEKLRSTSISQQPVAKLLQSDNENFTIQETTNETTPEDTFLSSIVARVSWSHHIILRQKEPHLGKRLWYMLNSIEHGISRNILASTRFLLHKRTLPIIYSKILIYSTLYRQKIKPMNAILKNN